MKNSIIGKYYKRNDLEKCETHIVLHVVGFDGKYYEVTQYSLSLGNSVKESNLKLNPDFYKKSNFIEIDKEEYEIFEYLHRTSGKLEYDW